MGNTLNKMINNFWKRHRERASVRFWVHGDPVSPVRLLTQKTALLSFSCPGESPDSKLGWFACRSNQFALCGCRLHQSYRYGCKTIVLSYSKTNKIKGGRNQKNVCVQRGNQLWFSFWSMRFEGKIWISKRFPQRSLEFPLQYLIMVKSIF